MDKKLNSDHLLVLVYFVGCNTEYQVYHVSFSPVSTPLKYSNAKPCEFHDIGHLGKNSKKAFLVIFMFLYLIHLEFYQKALLGIDSRSIMLSFFVPTISTHSFEPDAAQENLILLVYGSFITNVCLNSYLQCFQNTIHCFEV